LISAGGHREGGKRRAKRGRGAGNIAARTPLKKGKNIALGGAVESRSAKKKTTKGGGG